MGTKKKGFSLIEVVLFLGITGLIVSVMLIGVGAGLNQQKYRDALSSLMGYVQNQYNLVANVNNTRPNTEVCNGARIISGIGPTAGRSDCTVVGMLLRTVGGEEVTSTKVISTVDPTTLPKNSDDSETEVLRDARLVSAPNPDTYNPSWDTTIVTSGVNDPMNFSILIVRSPTTGVIHTFVSNSGTTEPANFFVGASATANAADLKLCLAPNGLLGFSNQPSGIMIAADAANSSGVSFVSQGSC